MSGTFILLPSCNSGSLFSLLHQIHHNIFFSFLNFNQFFLIPERDAWDASELHFPFQHLLNLAFLGPFFHLLTTNQVDALRGQDQVSLDGLGSLKNKKEKWEWWAIAKSRSGECGRGDILYNSDFCDGHKTQESRLGKGYLKPAIKLVDRIRKVDTLPLGQKLSQLRFLLQPNVVADKVSVYTVLPPLFGVVQDVWGWWTKHFKQRLCVLSSPRRAYGLWNSPSSLICSYFFLAMNLLQDFWMILAKVSNFLSLISSRRKSYGDKSNWCLTHLLPCI